MSLESIGTQIHFNDITGRIADDSMPLTITDISQPIVVKDPSIPTGIGSTGIGGKKEGGQGQSLGQMAITQRHVGSIVNGNKGQCIFQGDGRRVVLPINGRLEVLFGDTGDRVQPDLFGRRNGGQGGSWSGTARQSCNGRGRRDGWQGWSCGGKSRHYRCGCFFFWLQAHLLTTLIFKVFFKVGRSFSGIGIIVTIGAIEWSVWKWFTGSSCSTINLVIVGITASSRSRVTATRKSSGKRNNHN
mmetsp:Transcript_18560/g.45969  ORF Transcript_18560/g.45969 Transcript_18560/m.45969 type:complete len:244 (+) Transcript_18560:643-1374(+)